MKRTLLLLILGIGMGLTGWGQSIFDNPITGTNPNTSNPYTTGQTVNANITVSGIGRGSGITGANANNRYSANGWSTSTIDLNDYFYFTITPNSGYKINFVSFVYTGQVSSGTPSFAFRSSLDSYVANIGSPTTTGVTIDLSGSTYQNISTAITFRFYAFGLALASTTYSINDFTFNGTVASNTPPTITLSSPSQVGTGNINQGATNQILSRFKAEVTVANATLNSLAFTTAGSYVVADMVNFKLFYNTSDVFGSASSIGTISSSLGTGSHTFSSLTQLINSGNTGYFWITCDVNALATPANTINVVADPTLTFASGTPTGTISVGGTQTIQEVIPSIAISSPNPAVAVGNITQNTINNVIYRFDNAVTIANATISGLQVTTSGTYVASDLTNLKVWYSSDETFSAGSDVLLSTKTTSLGAGTQVFPDWTNQVISSGTTGYIFITTDIPCTASATNTIAVNAVTTSDVTFISGNKSGTTSAGGSQTIVAATVANVTGTNASVANAQSVLTWTNPTGCYDEIMIVAKATSTISGTPSGDGSSYSASLVYGSGTAFDGGSVVYKGSTSSQTVTGLTNGTTYYYKFYTRFGTSWSAGVETNAVPAGISLATDYFRSKTSGNWNAIGTWESSTDGATNWINATLTPTSSANIITILNGHTVTVTASVSVDQVTVNTGGQITINSSQILTIANGADATDLSVNGIIENKGTLTLTGTAQFGDGGIFRWNQNAGSFNNSNVTWGSGSTVEITGSVATAPTNLSQSFYNFTWNCTGQTSWLTLNLTGSFIVNGDLKVLSTGGGSVGIVFATLTARTYNITGNLIIDGGKLELTSNSGIVTMNLGGNLSLSNNAINLLDLGYGNANPTGSYRSIVYISGNLIVGTGSTLTCSDNAANDDYGNIVFEKQGSQTFTNNGTLSWIDFDVDNGSTLILNSNLDLGSGQTATKYNGFNVQSGGTLDFNGFNITDNSTGEGTFEVINGGTLLITSANGITSDGLSGNVLVGYPAYNTGANYTYKGTTTQVTGNGLPATVNNLTVSGTSDLTISNAGLLTVSVALGIVSGAKLTVGRAQSVTVNGNTSLGGTECLVLKSNDQGTASFINDGTITGIGTAKIERYLTNYESGTDRKYHFISSPVASQAIRPEFVANAPLTAVDFYKFDEVYNMWINTKIEDASHNIIWNPEFEPDFAIGRGYMVAYPLNPVTKNFTGNLNSYPAGTPLVLNCTNTAGQGDGWNLLGNPFASAIDWDGIIKGNGMDNALYYYDALVENYRYYIRLGTLGSYGSGSRYIPAGQGFMVHAQTTGTKTITIQNADRIHEAQSTFYKEGETLPGSLSVKVVSGNFEDDMFVHFNTDATTKFDGDFDAYKRFSYNTLVPQLYTISTDDKKLAINGLPTLSEGLEIPVYFKAGVVGEQTITADVNQMVAHVYLTDLKTGITQNLSENPVFTFTAAQGDAPQRFKLHFNSVGITDNEATQGINIWSYQNKLCFNSSKAIHAQLSVYNITGQLIYGNNIELDGVKEIGLNAPFGWYIVKLVTDSGVTSKKIFLN